jgi:hypothetical protein
MSYYGDLSDCSNRNEVCSDEDDWSEDDNFIGGDEALDSAKRTENEFEVSRLWRRSVIHLDIDCFYCQCEEIDRDLREVKPPRPLAIGQKHIIVTSNYEARKYGVKKLQLRESAKIACPDLWIVEGSDLEHYRRHSRSVYEAFRSGLQAIATELVEQQQDSSNILLTPPSGSWIPVQKGSGMDEMLADFTWAVDQITAKTSSASGETSIPTFSGSEDVPLYIYGETASSSTAVLVEDQTGAMTTVSYRHVPPQKRGQGQECLSTSRENVHQNCGTDLDRSACMNRLQVAGQLAARIRRHIYDKTKFVTTIGISVSPLLAKLATDLQKPDSVNLLYPWRSANFMPSMPLRKLNKVGNGTIKALDQCLELHSTGPKPQFWTIQ